MHGSTCHPRHRSIAPQCIPSYPGMPIPAAEGTQRAQSASELNIAADFIGSQAISVASSNPLGGTRPHQTGGHQWSKGEPKREQKGQEPAAAPRFCAQKGQIRTPQPLRCPQGSHSLQTGFHAQYTSGPVPITSSNGRGPPQSAKTSFTHKSVAFSAAPLPPRGPRSIIAPETQHAAPTHQYKTLRPSSKAAGRAMGARRVHTNGQ